MVHVVAIAANVGRLPPAKGTREDIFLRVTIQLRKPGLKKVNSVPQGNTVELHPNLSRVQETPTLNWL